MQTIAVTGHMDLAGPSTGLVRAALHTVLAEQMRLAGTARVVGVSCLAPGADTLFADAVLNLGGDLAVVLPSRDYRASVVSPEHAPSFNRLLEAAVEITVMPFDTATEQAYEAANAELVRRADLLVAVWDGQPSEKGGGTASTVEAAREAGIPVVVVWPERAARLTDQSRSGRAAN